MSLNLIRSKGTPEYVVWAYNKDTHKWDGWGEVHSPDDYPDMLDRINRGEYRHSFYTGNNNYTKVIYLKEGNPNRLGIV